MQKGHKMGFARLKNATKSLANGPQWLLLQGALRLHIALGNRVLRQNPRAEDCPWASPAGNLLPLGSAFEIPVAKCYMQPEGTL